MSGNDQSVNAQDNIKAQFVNDSLGAPTPPASFPRPEGAGSAERASFNCGSSDAGNDSPPSDSVSPAPACPSIPDRKRKSRSDWKYSFVDDQGNRVDLDAVKMPVNFAWCEKHLNISRRTLWLAAKQGKLLTLGRPSLTRTDFVYRFMVGSRNQIHTQNRRKETCTMIPTARVRIRLPRRQRIPVLNAIRPL